MDCWFFLFLLVNHAIDAAFLESGLEAAVAGDAAGRGKVAFFPAVDQPRLPDERPGHGDVIDPIFPERFTDDFQGPEAAYCHDWALTAFLISLASPRL